MVLAFFAEAVRAHNNTISNESNKLFLIRLIVFKRLNR